MGEWEEGVGYRCRIRRGKVYVVRSRDEMTNGKDRIGRKEKEKEERRRRGELPIEISDSRESSSAEEDVQDDEEEEEEEAPHEIQEYFTTQIRKQKVIGQADAFNDIQALHTAHFILDRETVHKLSLNPYLVNTALNILDTAKHDSDAKDDNGVDQAAKKALNKACSPTNVLASVQMTQLAYLRLNAFPCPDKIRDTIEDKYEDDRELKRRKLSWCMVMISIIVRIIKLIPLESIWHFRHYKRQALRNNMYQICARCYLGLSNIFLIVPCSQRALKNGCRCMLIR